MIIVFFLGLVVGGFLSICIDRIPLKGKKIISPFDCRSHKCHLKWYELIAAVRYVLSRSLLGSGKILALNLSVGLLNTVLYLWLYSKFGLSIVFIAFAFLASALIVVSYIDIKYKIIPDCIILVLFIIGVIFNVVDRELTIWNSMTGFFAASVPLLMLAVLSGGKGMGGGDIKLMAVVGIFLGWKLACLALVIASILQTILGINLILFKIIQRKDPIPFGPFLSVGIMTAVFYGNDIILWIFT